MFTKEVIAFVAYSTVVVVTIVYDLQTLQFIN